MTGRNRARQLLAKPDYRTSVAFFILAGLALIGVAAVTPPFWSSLTQQVAVVFITVGMLRLIWDFLGGDPVKLEIEALRPKIELMARVAESSLDGLLLDLVERPDRPLGVERIWPNRAAWQSDQRDGCSTWHRRVLAAREVAVLSSTFWRNWLEDETFCTQMGARLADGLRLKLIIYDRDSNALQERFKAEEGIDRPVGELKKTIHRMRLELGHSLGRLAAWSNEIDASLLPAVRLTTRVPHPAQIIRADDRMLVAHYLIGKTGRFAPTVQLVDATSMLFGVYKEQFEILWKRGRELEWSKDIPRPLFGGGEEQS